jgi:hypothetical protein
MRALVLLLMMLLGQGGYLPTVPANKGAAGVNNIVIQNACFNWSSGSFVTSITLGFYNAGAGNGCSSTTFTPVAGDKIIIHAYGQSASDGSGGCAATDSAGNTVTTSLAHFFTNELHTVCVDSITTGGNLTLTLNNGSVNTIWVSTAIECSGCQSTLDGTVQFGTTSGTAWALPSITTANANDMIFACGGATGGSELYTAGAPFTIYNGSYFGGSNPSEFCEENKVTVTGTYNPTATAGTSQAGTAVTFGVKST